MSLAAGTRVGRYTVHERLGAGGVGQVYRVEDADAGTAHALKVLSHASAGHRARLLREGHAQAALAHPNIVAVTDFVTVGDSPGIVMELVDGPDLATLIRTRALSIDELDGIVRGILSGVDAAHDAGLVHRDLKPSNILLARTGGGFVPKVADFGLVLTLDDVRRTRTGQLMGTPAYMAPEQIRDAKRVDRRADIWALGAILYELVTRHRAFVADDLLDLYLRVGDGRFAPVREWVPAAPDRFVDAIEGALVVDLDDRIPDCELLWEVWSTRGAGETTVAPALVGTWSEAETVFLGDEPTVIAPATTGARRAVLVGVRSDGTTADALARSLRELTRLCATLDYTAVDTVTQRQPQPDGRTFVGAGKLAAITDRVAAADADAVVIDGALTPTQLRHLEDALGAPVLDRTAVILDIFAEHARTRTARLQVEIAKLMHERPRLREQSTGARDRQRGMFGRSAGESELKQRQRQVDDRLHRLRQDLERAVASESTRRGRRRDRQVALVGYTNAGKSTLLRALTGTASTVADRPFATLDTQVRRLHPPARPPVLVTDTVGFIRDLPHALVASFRSTLGAAAGAALLVHVADASDPDLAMHLEVTDAALAEVGAGETRRLLVLNKCDRLTPLARATLQRTWPAALCISAHAAHDVERLRTALLDALADELVHRVIDVPWSDADTLGLVHRACEILEATYSDAGVRFTVRAPPAVAARLPE